MDGLFESIQDVKLDIEAIESPHAFEFRGQISPVMEVFLNCWTPNKSGFCVRAPITVRQVVGLFDEVYAFVYKGDRIIAQGSLSAEKVDLGPNVEQFTLHRLMNYRVA